MPIAIERIDLLISNAYLVGSGKRRVLIDTGSAFAYSRLRGQLDRHGVRPGDLSAVILTHAHPDHAGNAARLKRDFGATIAIHAAEAAWMRTGTTELYQRCGVFGHILNSVMSRTFEPCAVDRALNGGETIDVGDQQAPLGILHTPGHTPGHICVTCADDVFAGDLMRGGVLRRNVVGSPFFVQNRRELTTSIETIKRRHSACLHFGHGLPASGAVLDQTRFV